MTDSKKPLVLIVDDDHSIREPLAQYLEANGIAARTANSAVAARKFLADNDADLIVLDVMMPGEDGLAFCRELRRQSSIPVIFVSALGDEADRIIGIETGGDDYLVKPFSPRELLSRLRAILRRQPISEDRKQPRPVGRQFGRWTLVPDQRDIVRDDGLRVTLTSHEYRLLQALVRRPGILLTREQLLEEMHGRLNVSVFDRSIDTQISRLRAKLGDDSRAPSFIRTARGDGYMFVAEVHQK